MTERIGERLKRIRDESRLSQRDFARSIGVAFSTWQTIEGGKNVPSGETLLKIAALGFNPGWILTGQGSPRIGAPCAAADLELGSELPGPGLDVELMGRVVEMIAGIADACGTPIAPFDLGRKAAEKYAELVAASEDPGERRAMLKLMAVQLKAQLA